MGKQQTSMVWKLMIRAGEQIFIEKCNLPSIVVECMPIIGAGWAVSCWEERQCRLSQPPQLKPDMVGNISL
jgi:hypothetical protein